MPYLFQDDIKCGTLCESITTLEIASSEYPTETELMAKMGLPTSFVVNEKKVSYLDNLTKLFMWIHLA